MRLQRNFSFIFVKIILKGMIVLKKILSVVICAFLIVGAFAGCKSENTAKPQKEVTPAVVRIGALKGPTAMGMLKLFEDADNKKTENSYEYKIAGSPDELTPKLLKGDMDIIAVPANLGSVLFNNSNGAVKVIAVNNLGAFYIVEKGKNEIKTFSDLEGKTIYATGKGSTPDYAISYLLSENKVKNTQIIWKNEANEVLAQMSAEKDSVALLPQPFVSVAEGKFNDLRVVLDLSKEWDSLNSGSRLVMSSIIVRKDFADKNADSVKEFLRDYKNSCDFVNENIEESSQLAEKYGIINAQIAKKAIPFCNIVCITGNEMKNAVKGYLDVLSKQNIKAVGGKLPTDEYYGLYE